MIIEGGTIVLGRRHHGLFIFELVTIHNVFHHRAATLIYNFKYIYLNQNAIKLKLKKNHLSSQASINFMPYFSTTTTLCGARVRGYKPREGLRGGEGGALFASTGSVIN